MTCYGERLQLRADRRTKTTSFRGKQVCLGGGKRVVQSGIRSAEHCESESRFIVQGASTVNANKRI